MQTKTLTALVAGTTTALAGLSGCASDSYSGSRSGMASTNTSRISSGEHAYAMKPGRVDWLDNTEDKYASQPRDNSRAVQVNFNGETYTLSNDLVLDARLIPRSNSTTARWADHIETTANDSNSYFVNASYDDLGNIQLTTKGSPKESFFITERVPSPSVMVKDEFNTRFEEMFAAIQRSPSKVTVEGKTLVPIPDRDLIGKRANVYLDIETIRPYSETIRTPDSEGGFTTEFKGGLIATGWYIAKGQEIIAPEWMGVNENAQGFRILGGEESPEPRELTEEELLQQFLEDY